MRRWESSLNRKICSVLIVIIVVAILGTWYFYAYPNHQAMDDGFEEGSGGWVADADVPADPNKPGHLVAWNITRTTYVANSGRYSLKFFIDGVQDDGTLWIENKISVRNKARIQVKVSFELYSEHESFNAIADVCAYAGLRNPEVEGDFTVLGPANEIAGWKKYTYTTILDVGSSDEVWFAVGITVRWETRMTYYIDDVEIEVRW